MVDSVSAEARRKQLLDESIGCIYPEDAVGIRQRYKDTSLVLFKEQLSHQHADNKSFLSFGTRRSSTVSEYGNTPIIVRKSRSANGELSKVAQQWPSLRGKSSLSNYTLHEASVKDEGEEDETETEEENESKVNTSTEEGVTSITEEQFGSGGKRETLTRDGQVSYEDSTAGLGAKQDDFQVPGVNDNRKSFSHYDFHLQRRKEFIDEEANDGDGEEALDKENGEDEKDAESMRTVLEVEGVDHKILLVKSSTTKKDHSLPNASASQVESVPEAQQKVVVETSNDKDNLDNKTKSVPVESHIQTTSNLPNSSEANTCILHSKSSLVNNVHNDKSDLRIDTDKSDKSSSDDWSRVELKIVEPSDVADTDTKSFNCAADNTTNFASKLLNAGDDNDDVVFIDEVSPRELGKKFEIGTNASQEESQVQNVDVPAAPKQQTKQLSEPSSPILVRAEVNEKCIGNGSLEELDKCNQGESQNGLLALPVRSPTPPKKSPRRSPRIPKNKDRNFERPSSLDSPSDLEQPSTSRTVVSSTTAVLSTSPTSAVISSPTGKHRESSRIFNFSLKKERSKSVSSLSSRKHKEKEKVVRSESEDPGAINHSLVSDVDDDTFENSRKRVGVRSMVIDGTIKRNFIVIHPSDDSETIGLAPKSSFTNGERKSIKKSKALSSVKSHITGISSTKVESFKRISSKVEMKEELKNSSKDNRDRESLNDDTGLERLRFRDLSIKKHSESHMHESTISLSSTVSQVNSKAPFESSKGLSEVECDAVNVSSPGIILSSTKTTSRLCVVM